ncbi:MAG: T9SS type A sorting domain-containing protein [Dysgonamonadaceae bacterium]|jgi:N-acetylneuraminic acid mutarotase|nr:T9SS type A sorting domain-containing protein [Dysgonamonadaceae bacterium]
MKTIQKLFVLVLTTLFFAFGTIDAVMAVNWNKKTKPFPGEGRNNAVSFVIGNAAYIGTGYAYKNNANIFYKDFWKYDSSADAWTKIADFPGEARYRSVAFSSNGKGYVGIGSGNGSSIFKDFYEYNPANNTWSKIADFPDARYGVVSFSINGVGYVGSGYDGTNLKGDFYKYESGSWKAIAALPSGEARMLAAGFSLNGLGYIAGGGPVPSVFGGFDSMFEYNPQTNVWSRKAYSSRLSSNVILSYVSGGIPYFSVYNDFFKYNASEEYFEFLGDVFKLDNYFSSETFFVINNVPYMTLGSFGGFFDTTFNIDLWYDADAVAGTGIHSVQTETVAFYPNPASDLVTVQVNATGSIEIHTLSGSLVKKQIVSATNNSIDVSSLNKGIYILTIKAAGKSRTFELIKK